MLDQISEYCKALRLSQNIVENCKNIDKETHEEFLLELLKSEVKYRTETKIKLLLKRAGFHKLKTFGDYDFKEVKLPQTITIEEIKNIEFISKTQNLILYGNVGTGNYRKFLVIERNERNGLIRKHTYSDFFR